MGISLFKGELPQLLRVAFMVRQAIQIAAKLQLTLTFPIKELAQQLQSALVPIRAAMGRIQALKDFNIDEHIIYSNILSDDNILFI